MSSTTLIVRHPSKAIQGTVQLTGSKSESNRALIIQALSQNAVQVENLSEAADTVIMAESLAIAKKTQTTGESCTVDIGPAGTAMRFLTSFLNLQNADFILTGTARMQQRPIGILVDALRTLGANIRYLKQDGFPPIHIQGSMQQQQREVHIQGDVSSQYLSSLLLIAAALPQGLVLVIVK